MFSHEGNLFCQNEKVKPRGRSKVLPRRKGLIVNQKILQRTGFVIRRKVLLGDKGLGSKHHWGIKGPSCKNMH